MTAKYLKICAFAVFSVLCADPAFARDANHARPTRADTKSKDSRVVALRAASQADFAKLKNTQPAARAGWRDDGQPGPEWITDLAVPTADAPTLEKRASDFLAQYPNLLGVDVRTLRPIGQEGTRNRSVVRFLQFSDATASALPVLDAHVLVAFDRQNQVVSVTNAASLLRPFDLGQLSRAQAIEIALHVRSDAAKSARPAAQRVLECAQVLVSTPFITVHAWVLQVEGEQRSDRDLLTIDATSGKVLSKHSMVVH